MTRSGDYHTMPGVPCKYRSLMCALLWSLLLSSFSQGVADVCRPCSTNTYRHVDDQDSSGCLPCGPGSFSGTGFGDCVPPLAVSASLLSASNVAILQVMPKQDFTLSIKIINPRNDTKVDVGLRVSDE